MSLHRTRALARHSLGLLLMDPAPTVILVIQPLILLVFLRQAFETYLTERGVGLEGAQQAVPAMITLFSFFLVGFIGFLFFIEHGWGTWVRLRVTPARGWELLAGKTLAPLVAALLQMAILTAVGVLAFDFEFHGSPLAFALVALALSVCLVSIGVALAAVCTTWQQLNAFSAVGAMLLGGLGGALVPHWLLPGWAQAIAPATPTYWAMRGFQSVTIDGEGVGSVVLPVVVLLAFSVGFGMLATWRFRFDAVKTGITS